MTGPRLFELARELVRTPSVTTEGNRRVAELLRDTCLRDTDLDVRLDPAAEPGNVNLIAAKGLGATEPPLLLNSHLDTVPPGDPALWTACEGDPFAAVVRDGLLYGLGSADAKLDALCKSLALVSFRGRLFRRGVIFAGTWGEERGLLGARALLGNLPAKPVAAWAGEPTELELVTRHKGLLVLSLEATTEEKPGPPIATTRLRFEGRSAHSSTPHLGENAIFRALDFVSSRRLPLVSLSGGDAANKVPALCEVEVGGDVAAEAAMSVVGHGRARLLPRPLMDFLVTVTGEIRRLGDSPPLHDEHFDPPVRTANVGVASAAPGRARLVADIRPLPGENTDTVRQSLSGLVASHPRSGLSTSMTVERDNPALEYDETSPAVLWSVQALASLGRPTTLRTKSGCTEAGLYAAAGIPAVVFGPGRSAGNVHRPNECVPLSDLEGAVAFYRRLLEEVCAA